jgi:REP-associated tyrosine transposase
VYHLTTRGNRHQPIYLTEHDCELFCHLVTKCVRRFEWRCHSLCLIPNHYHLLMRTLEPNLSRGMELLNGTYAKWFNHTHGFEGHLFERRFRSVVIESDAHLLEVIRYIALNPVRAGLCNHPSDWKWSSYRALIGAAPIPEYLSCEWLLSLFGKRREQASKRLAAFVEGRLPVAA